MRKNKVKNQEPDDRFVKVQQVQKNGKGQDIMLEKYIPAHIAEDPKKFKTLKRLGFILEGEAVHVSREQIEEEKQMFREWANSIDSVTILEGALKLDKTPYKLEILNERIKELSTPKKEPKAKKEPVTPETPQQ